MGKTGAFTKGAVCLHDEIRREGDEVDDRKADGHAGDTGRSIETGLFMMLLRYRPLDSLLVSFISAMLKDRYYSSPLC